MPNVVVMIKALYAMFQPCFSQFVATVHLPGLKLDPSNEQMRSSLREAEEAKASPSSDGGLFGNMFSNPEFLGKLATNATTRGFLAQPDFMAMLRDVGTNPSNINK